FLELDFSEVPAIIGVLTIHPLSGIVIVVLKNVLKVVLFQSTTAYAGELANMAVSLGYILPLTLMMRRKKNLKHVGIGLGIGVITMTIAGGVINYFITLPMYAKLFMPMESIIEIGHMIYSGIVDKGTLVLYSIVPFNLIKGTVVALTSVLIVKGLRPVIVHLGYRSQK
ncbi:MAG: ECF transporter S component, partial [Cellulosilyticum sp.]|nr:ECF transporter S component [Cellulosilyticum sp.]